MVFRDKNDDGYIDEARYSQPALNDTLLSVIYSQGKYFAYHAQDMDLKLNEKWDSSNKEEMTPTLRELCKKAYLVIRNMKLSERSLRKSGSLREEENKVRFLFYHCNQGTVVRVGDIVKFGRVPFKIKESSIEKLYKEESLESLERNITDIDSEDGGNNIGPQVKGGKD
jgi:hypothetical protein